MKCPNCGKKMKGETCKKCGYNSAAQVEVTAASETVAAPVTPTTPTVTVMPAVTPRVNYYTFDPANPNVWYPISTSTQAQPNITLMTTAQVQPTTIQLQPSAMTASQVQSTAATTTPAQQPAKEDDLATAVSKKVGKKAEKIAKKLAKKAEKKMTKSQKKAAKAVLDTVDKIEKKVPSNIASRLFAVVLIALCVLTFGGFKFYSVTDLINVNGVLNPEVSQGSMLAVLVNALQSEDKLFGIIPAFFSNGGSGTAYNLSVYIFTICAVVAVLYAVFAIFSKEKAPSRVRKSLFFLGAGTLDYAVSFSALLGSGENSLLTGEMLNHINLLSLGGYQVELLPLVIGGACLVLSFLFLIFRRRVKETIETTENENSLSC